MSVTVAQFRPYSPGLVGALEDSDLETHLASAEAILAGWCGWARNAAGALTFGSSAYVVQRDGPEVLQPTRLRLPVARVASVSEVVISTSWDWAGGTVLVEGTDFVLDSSEAMLRLIPTGQLQRWPIGDGLIRVSFTGGWDPYQPEVIAAVAAQARHSWSQRAGEGVSTIGLGGDTLGRVPASAVPSHVRALAVTAGLVVWSQRAS